jgi:hypothetical protein
MSRSRRRAVYRGSILIEMAQRGLLSRRQTAAALSLERDREAATKVGAPKASSFDPPIKGLDPAEFGRQFDAAMTWEAVKRALPPSHRRLLGDIERASLVGGKRGLSALTVKIGLADEKDANLVKRGMIAGLMEAVADHYRIPEEA